MERDRTTEIERRRYLRQSRQAAKRLRPTDIRDVAIGLEDENIERFIVGLMDHMCESCGAYNFQGERVRSHFSICCNNGKIKLIPLEEPPPTLKALLDGSHPSSVHFKQNIRAYNSSLALASMNTNLASFQANGPYCYRIHGQVYYCTSALQPPDGLDPHFAQLYILDSDLAIEERDNQARHYSLDRDLLLVIQDELTRVNPYISSFRMMKEVVDQENKVAYRENRRPCEVRMYLKTDRTLDLRRYNAARSSEVAIVFVSHDGSAPPCMQRDIMIYPRGSLRSDGRQEMIGISRLSPNCDPMVYPICFSNGEQGWSIGMQHARQTRQRNNISVREFWAYRFQVRNQQFPTLQLCGKLYQQLIVDSYTKVEGTRLDFFRLNQSRLRVEFYQGLMDYSHSSPTDPNTRIGRRYILPSTFIGSPRCMQQNYQDAMSMVRKYGKPDLFITFTCNPGWPEIKNMLRERQSSVDRPDIIVRVFHLKLQQLLKEIVKDGVLGNVIAHCWTIEFQKRGLPHAHILIILDRESKTREEVDIDSRVSAELPDLSRLPRLYELVSSHMIHGPCGDLNPTCVCMDDGVCTKKFPKDYHESTIKEVNGYPIYRRRNSGIIVTKNNIQLDNRWVVPFNKYLILRFNAHINVEVCASIKSIKYIYKYIYKGHDCASIVLEASDSDIGNEIKSYLNARYISACEASWRLFEFGMHGRSHAIIRLPIHLENMQQVFFVEGEENQALETARAQSTKLLEWFEINKKDTTARNYLYSEIPEHYTWGPMTFNDPTTNCPVRKTTWISRVNFLSNIIGRIYSVSPKDGERYYLRILLLHIRGAESFLDLRTYNGTLYPSFREAVLARGLVEDDSEWAESLQEASSFKMPRELRNLFVVMLVFCHPHDPLNLFDRFKDSMCEDYLRTKGPIIAVQYCLKHLEEILAAHNTSLHNFNLPMPDVSMIDEEETCILRPNIPAVNLNPEQKFAIDIILAALGNDFSHQRCFFLDGSAGSGKTTLYTQLCKICSEQGISYLTVASTGIASTLLPNGRTVHSAFKLPLNLDETSISLMGASSDEANSLAFVQLIIWDESTMSHAQSLRVVDNLLKDITGDSRPFGGKVMLLGGDFRQCLPVVPRGTRTKIIESCIFKSSLWQHFKILRLSRNMRAIEDAFYANWVLNIGNGSSETENISVPNSLISRGSLIADIFGTDVTQFTASHMKSRCILSPKNEETLKINEEILAMLPGETIDYYSADTIEVDNSEDPSNYPTEFLNSLTLSGMPPHHLRLKIGAILILLRNLSPKNGLYNGTRLILRKALPRTLVCSSLDDLTKTSVIPRIDIVPTDNFLPYRFHRRQFPVRLAYAMTINKSQGQTFEKVGIFLPEPVFTHGQLYVAFSRVRTCMDVKVKIISGNRQGFSTETGFYTKNIVYHEALL